MPSVEHDGVVELFRDEPSLAPRLLRELCGTDVPAYAEVRVAEAQMTELIPVEFRADLVLELLDESGKCVAAIVMESQLEVAPRKRYTWPVYATVCRAERECPTALMVVAVNEDVATWANSAIDVGFGRGGLRPIVLGPKVLPKITDKERARQDPALAVLSAMTHGNSSEGLEVLLALLSALEGLERELAWVYFEVVWKRLCGPMQKALEALLMERQTGRDVKYPAFIERLIEERALKEFRDGELKGFRDGEVKGFHDGEVKGFHDGEVKTLRLDILRGLRRRGVPLTSEQVARIQACDDRALLDRWFDNVFDATNGDDVFR